MIHTSYRRLGILTLLATASAYCDTVNTVDNLSVHGTIKEITATTITLEGNFASGTKSYTFPRSNVTRIVINSIIFNSGAPPKTYGLGPGDNNKKDPQPQTSQTDTIVLKGNSRKPRKLLAINASTVRCDESSYPRSMALYVLLGQAQ